jgi:acetolactate synthase-1/2/3 large subunit
VLDWAAREALRSLAEQLELPVAHSVAGKGSLVDSHPLAVGMTGAGGSAAADGLLADADVVLALGSRVGLGEVRARVVQIDVDQAHIAPADIVAIADPGFALRAVGAAVRARVPRPTSRPALREGIAVSRAAFTATVQRNAEHDSFPVRPERLLGDMHSAVPDDTIIVADAGPWTGWLVDRYPLAAAGRLIVTSYRPAFGFGPAAAVGIQLSAPGRVVVALVDDISMAAQLPAVPMAVEYGLPVVFVVLRGTAASLDFAAIARAFGADGYRITGAGVIASALLAALRQRRPAVLDVPTAYPRDGHAVHCG